MVIVSVLAISFFLMAKFPKKVDNECCLNGNPRNFYNVECKKYFHILFPVHETCQWDFVGSTPKCV